MQRSRSIEGGSSSAYNDIRVTADGGVIIAGDAFSQDAGYRAKVVKLDAQLDITWEREFDFVNVFSGSLKEIRAIPGGGYVCCGQVFRGGVGHGLVMRLTDDGDIMWQREILDDQDSGQEFDFSSVEFLSDGAIVVVGSNVHRSEMLCGGTNCGNELLILFDADGNETRRVTYDEDFISDGETIDRTPDGGFIFAGTSRPSEEVVQPIVLRRYDASLNILWDTRYSPGRFSELPRVRATADGGYIGTARVVDGDDECHRGWSVFKLLPDGRGPGGSNAAVDWSMLYCDNTPRPSPVAEMPDGGFVVEGISSVSYRDILMEGSAHVRRLDARGRLLWERAPFLQGHDAAFHKIERDADGNGAVVGSLFNRDTESIDAVVYPMFGLNGERAALSSQCVYGGGARDEFHGLAMRPDREYAAAGLTYSFGAGEADVFVVRSASGGCDAPGLVLGGPLTDVAHGVTFTSDGGMVVVGYTESYGAGGRDGWIVKIGADQQVQWQVAYGGSNDDALFDVLETAGGELVAVGSTPSFGAGDDDFLLLRLDADGNGISQQTYGGARQDVANYIEPTSDGGFAIIGFTRSFGGGLQCRVDDPLDLAEAVCPNVWVLKLAPGDPPDGSLQWQKTYSTALDDRGYAIREIPGEGYWVAADSNGLTDSHDVWLLRLDNEGEIADSCPNGVGNDTSVSPVVANGAFAPTSASVVETPSSDRLGSSGRFLSEMGGLRQCYGLTPIQRHLEVRVEGGGSVLSDSGDIDCGTDCEADLDAVTTLLLTPVPDHGWEFAEWREEECADGAVSMLQDRVCTAVFEEVSEWPLRILVEGQGSVDVDVPEAPCADDCDYVVPVGETVVMTPNPSERWEFFRWSGDPDCADGEVVMDDEKSCTAEFAPLDRFVLSLTFVGKGSVVSSPEGLNCAVDCMGFFAPDEEVTLMPTAGLGFLFSRWEGDCVNGMVTMDADKDCTAVFSQIPPSGGGGGGGGPPPAVCGNGAVETGEQCDDGNTVPGDGCSADCMTEAVNNDCNGNGVDDDLEIGGVVLTDGEFADADWMVDYVLEYNATGETEHWDSGGNPGARRRMFDHLPAADSADFHYPSVRGRHIYTAMAYDPATQGPIVTIDYSEDTELVKGGEPVDTGPLVLQDGTYYYGPEHEFSSDTWLERGFLGLEVTDFQDNRGEAGAQSPDFSASGSPMMFGYYRLSRNMNAGASFDVIHGIDNWAITVVRNQDCNGNDVLDECDIAAGAPDVDMNGVPDECDFNCGNGVVDPGEECDDANVIPGDGCENDCTLTPP